MSFLCPRCADSFDSQSLSCSKHATTKLVSDLRGREISGRKISDVIGAGNIGLVYSARHNILGRHEAVKVIFDTQANATRRFYQEANVLSRLRNPHSVRIFDFVEIAEDAGKVACLFMELVTGNTLLRAATNRSFDLPRASNVIYQVCQALGEAHAEGIVHRDIKPGNIMLAQDRDGRDSARVLDFGLAKMAFVGMSDPNQEPTREDLTQMGQVVGTLAYMAPEQISSPESISRATDIYSLGLVYHWLLTGANPMKDDSGNSWSTMQNQISKPLPPINQNEFPTGVVDLIGRMTAKVPGDRPASVIEVQQQLVDHGRIRAEDIPILRFSTPTPFTAKGSSGSQSRSDRDGRRIYMGAPDDGYTQTLDGPRRTDRLLLAIVSLVVVLVVAVVGGWVAMVVDRPPEPTGGPGPGVSSRSKISGSSLAPPAANPGPTPVVETGPAATPDRGVVAPAAGDAPMPAAGAGAAATAAASEPANPTPPPRRQARQARAAPKPATAKRADTLKLAKGSAGRKRRRPARGTRRLPQEVGSKSATIRPVLPTVSSLDERSDEYKGSPYDETSPFKDTKEDWDLDTHGQTVSTVKSTKTKSIFEERKTPFF